jgi:predicted N-formylglutamate amidohydrolase
MQQLGLDAGALDLHIAWDIGSAELARGLADLLDAPLILGGYSRLLIDLNRQPDDASAIPPVSDGTLIPGNADVDEQQRALRIRSFFEPYHAAIRARLDQFQAAGLTPAFLSVHTCTPVFDGLQRPWHIGVMWDKDPRIAIPMLQQLNSCCRSSIPFCIEPNHLTVGFFLFVSLAKIV